MTRIGRALVSLIGGALAIAAGAGPSAAQAPPPSVDVAAPQPASKAPGFELERTMPLDQRGIRDGQYYPGYDVKSEHDPAFVHPLVKTIATSPTSGVRVGLSVWTAPALPYDIPQETGGVAFGLSFIWSVPVEQKKDAPVPAPGGRP
jgi:hypothetical protein